MNRGAVNLLSNQTGAHIHRLKIVGLSVFVNVAIVNIILLWQTMGINDSFVFERVGILITQYANNSNSFIEGFETFPYSSSFLLTVHLLTNLDIIDSIFIPIIPLISIFPIYLFSRILFKDMWASFFVSIPVYFYVFGRYSHYYEYAIAELMFLCFIYSLYRYYNTYNRMFFINCALFYLAVKFFGPPIETWAVLFVATLVIISYTIYKIDRTKIPSPGFNALAMFFVMALAYNPKFYNQFLIRDSDTINIFNNLNDFITSVFSHSSLQNSDFTIIPTSHPIKIYYLFAITIPIIMKLGYDIYKKDVSSWIHNKDFLYCLILISVFIADLTIYGSIGLINLRYIVLIYPIIAAYFLYKSRIGKKYFIAYVFALIFLSAWGNIWTIQNEIYPFSENQLESNIVWSQKHINDGAPTLMGHYIYTSLIAASSIIDTPLKYKAVQYNSLRYGGMIDNSKGYLLDFKYLLIDIDSLSYPIRQGPPEWTFFEPLGKKYNMLDKNTNLNKISCTGSFELYSPTYLTTI